jgi:hypothetical protein
MTFLLGLVWAAVAGFLSVAFMTLFEYPFWRKWGMEGVAEWQVNWVMVSMLSKNWKAMKNPILSLTIASHILHGVVAGVVFRLLVYLFISLTPFAELSILLDGALYGIALWLLFMLSARRTYEFAGQVKITNRGLLGSFLSNILYGLFLGLLIPVYFTP